MSESVIFQREELVRLLGDLAARCATVRGLAELAENDPSNYHLMPAIVAVAGGLGFAMDSLLAKLGRSDCAGQIDISDWVHPVIAEMKVEMQS